MISDTVKRLLQTGPTENFPHDPLLVIEEIVSNLDRIPATAHPLGFIHFDLALVSKQSPGTMVRLHIWDRRLTSPDDAGNIHDHTWELTSLVMLGSLRDKNFVPVHDSDGSFRGTRVIYGQTNEFEDAGRFQLRAQSDSVHRAGAVYSIPSRIVHESDPIGQPTVTLVIGTPDENAATLGPLILSRGAIAPKGTPSRRPVSKAEAELVLRDVAKSL